MSYVIFYSKQNNNSELYDNLVMYFSNNNSEINILQNVKCLHLNLHLKISSIYKYMYLF